MATSPVRAISISPCGRTMRSNASTCSCEPVTSIVSVRRETSTMVASKISANCMISARFSTAAETRKRAISRAIVPSGSMSRILITFTSLWSCLVTWSIGWTAPSSVSVMRETSGSSVGPTARVSMLKPRRLNSPATRARTPGLFSTVSERMCLRPVRTREASRSSSLIRSGVLASIASAHHVPCGGAGRDHREAVLVLGYVDVEQHRAVGLERGAHGVANLRLVLALHAGPAERLGKLWPIGAVAHLNRRVALLPEELLPLADHAEVAVVHQEDLHRDVVMGGRRHLLAGHDQRAVAREADDRVVGLGDLGADGRGEPEAHGPQTSGVDPLAGTIEVVVLRGPHLVLADVRGDDRLASRRLVHGLDHALGLDLGVRRVLVAQRIGRLPLADPLPPLVEAG